MGNRRITSIFFVCLFDESEEVISLGKLEVSLTAHTTYTSKPGKIVIYIYSCADLPKNNHLKAF